MIGLVQAQTKRYMNSVHESMLHPRNLGALAAALAVALPALAAEPVVPKWSRFETEFKSSVAYENPLQEVRLEVEFTSPAGQTERVDGFWDGGRNWKVRFSPATAGRWSYRTICSDVDNSGLHDRMGTLTCSSPLGLSPFQQHGPIVVGGGGILEHADGTPYFCLADVAWDGLRRSGVRDWQLYAFKRADQDFNAVQCSVWPGIDYLGEFAVTGFHDRIGINPAFFQRLDEKLELLQYAGLLSMIAPVLDLGTYGGEEARLPDDQAERLARYVVARYGGHAVLWVVALDSENQAEKVACWKKIGRSVFSAARAPVVLFTGNSPWAMGDFREEKWVDVMGYQTVTDLTEDALKWAVSGPLAGERAREEARPLLAFAPEENRPSGVRGRRFSAFDVRRSLYWGLAMGLNAGACYSANGVVHWDSTPLAPSESNPGSDLPLWHRSLFLPGAKQMAHLSTAAGIASFGRLRPAPTMLAVQPGSSDPARHIAAARSEDKRDALVYTPQDREIHLRVAEMPPSAAATWINPRTGQTLRAVGTVSGGTCQFSTPEPGDWVLALRAGGER